MIATTSGGTPQDGAPVRAGAFAQRHYAQAQPLHGASAANGHIEHNAIGRIDKVVGDVTVVRNGVAVVLHAGDAVFKNDIIKTGGGSSVSIFLADGTAVHLVANTRMALGEHHGDQDANAAILTLLEGTFAFIVGKAAHGDLKIATPVATMSVHEGTAGWAHELSADEIAAISSRLGSVTYSFAVINGLGAERHGAYDLLAGGAVLNTIGDPNLISYLDQQGNLISLPLDNSGTPAGDWMREALAWLETGSVVPGALGIHGSGGPIDGPSFPSTPNLNGEVPSFSFSGNNGDTPFNGFVPGNTPQGPLRPHSNLFIWNGFGNWDLNPSNWDQGFAPTSPLDIVIIRSGKANYTNGYSIASLTVDFGAILNIEAGTLGAPSINNAGIIQLNSSGVDPSLVIIGALGLVGGGRIDMLGPAAANFIVGAPGTAAALTNVDNFIDGSGNIGKGDGRLTFVNKATVDAAPLRPGDSGKLVVHTGNKVSNFGVLEATLSGELLFEDRLFNAGTVKAIGAGSRVLIDVKQPARGEVAVVNEGLFEATGRGLLAIESSLENSVAILAHDRGKVMIAADLSNDDGAIISAQGKGARVAFAGAPGDRISVDNAGAINAVQGGTISFSFAHVANEFDGSILASGRHSRIDIRHSSVGNDGVIAAEKGSLVEFRHDRVENDGLIKAKDGGSEIVFDRSQVENAGDIIAAQRGDIDFVRSHIDNDGSGRILADDRGSEVRFEFGGFDNSGLIRAADRGEVVFDRSRLDNERDGAIIADGTGSEVGFDRTAIRNSGRFDATDGGAVLFELSLIDNKHDGSIVADGAGSEVGFDRDGVDNSGLIKATDSGEVVFDRSLLDNERDGKIVADGANSEVGFDRTAIKNSGLFDATNRGAVLFELSRIDNKHQGEIVAVGAGSEVGFDRTAIKNSGLVEAADRGEVLFERSRIDNEHRGTIVADGVGSEVRFNRDRVDNSGLIEATHRGEVLFERSRIDNDRHGMIEADGRGSEVSFARDDVDNSGRIEAERDGVVRFDRSDVDNTGAITARHGGAVDFDRTDVDNAHGMIAAVGAGSLIELDRAHISGGRLSTASGGLIETVGGNSELSHVRITSGSHVEVDSHTTLTFDHGTTMTGGELDIEALATLHVEPSLAILNGVNVVNNGTIVVDPGTATLLVESGTIITGGKLTVGPFGTLTVNGSTLTGVKILDEGVVNFGIGDKLSPDDVITFAGTGTVNVQDLAGFDVTLAGLVTGDVIDLQNYVVTSALWNGTTLLLNGAPVAFSVAGGLPKDDTFAFISDGHGGTDLTILPQVILNASGAPEAGTEGAAIPLKIDIAGLGGGTSLTSLVISDIPAGATLSDGTASHTVTVTSGSFDVAGWNLTSLTITPPNDSNFILSAAITVTDGNGYSYSAAITETVTVSPLQPDVSFAQNTVSGIEATQVAIALKVSAGALAGDGSHNTIKSIVISDIPDGAILSDGANTFTAGQGVNATDVNGWTLDKLSVTPPNNASFTLTATVIEQDADHPAQTSTASAMETVTVVPALTVTAGANVHYTGGGSPVTLDDTLHVSDLVGTTLTSATVSIDGGPAPGDTLIYNNLTFTDGGTIHGTYDNGVLTLTAGPGGASVDDFQQALRSVTYSDGKYDPTNGGAQTSRTIDWSVSDGTVTSAVVTSQVTTSHVAPTVTPASSSAAYQNGNAPVILDHTITVVDNNSVGATLADVQVQLLNAQNGDLLSFNNGTDTMHFGDGSTITGVYQNGILTLTGTGLGVAPSVDDFQVAMRSVAYSFGGSDASIGGTNTAREIYWVVHDGNTVNGTNEITNPPNRVVLDNHQPSLALNQLVMLAGTFPSFGGSGDPGGIPMATIRTFAGNFAWGHTAEADGQLVSISQNQALFSLVGPNYGGDGRTTFMLPDLRGKVAIGQAADLVSGASAAQDPFLVVGAQKGSGEVDLTMSNVPRQWGGAGAPFNNDQPSLAINYMINVGGPVNGGTDMLGAVIPWLGSRHDAPSGYMFAEGQTLLISQYQGLYDIIGTAYGGDGITTFRLPNLVNATIMGAGRDAGHPVGPSGGQETTSINPANLPFPQGSELPVTNDQPSVALTYIIAVEGIFPGQGVAPDPTQPFVGEVMAYAGSPNHIPPGWALADGQLIPIAQNEALFFLLGTTYGGNGRTTFALPNLVGRVVVGTGTNGHDGPALGDAFGTDSLTITQNPGLPTVATTTLHTGVGPLTVASGQTFELTFGTNQTVTFAGSTGTLKLDDPAGFSGHIQHFSAPTSDLIDLVGINFNSAQFTASYAGGLFNVSDGTHRAAFSFDSFSDLLNLASDGNGGTRVTSQAATIASGGSLEIGKFSVGTVDFGNADGSLTLDSPGLFSGHVANFSSGAIDISGLNFKQAGFTETYDAGTGLLTLSDGTQNASLYLDHFDAANALNFAPDGSGGTRISAQPSASATIGAGERLEVWAQTNGTITFAAGTGELKLDDPTSFGGHIANFSGVHPNAAESDVIDLVGIDFNSATKTSYVGGQLTVDDGSHKAILIFDNFQGSFEFASDGHGGTLIFDPPKPATTVAAPDTGSGDQFRFVFKLGSGAGPDHRSDWHDETAAPAHGSPQGEPPAMEHVSGWMAEIGQFDHLPHHGMTPEQLQVHLTSGLNLH